jgi:predicted dehydrogenase
MDVVLAIEPTGPHLGHYFAGLKNNESVEKVYVADASGEMQSNAAENLGNKLAGFDQDIDAALAEANAPLAVVSLEAHRSPATISKCLEAGCHVIAEKPSCSCVEDFEAMAALAHQRDRQLMLAFANRATPHIQEARRIVREHIGPVYGIECHTVADQTRVQKQKEPAHWLFQKEKSGGGHLIWLGIHAVDWMQFVCDAPIVQVGAICGNIGGTAVDVEDSAVLNLQFESGMLGTLTSAYYIDKGKHISMNIWGKNGWLRMMPNGEYKIVWQEYGSEEQVIDYRNAKVGGAYAPFIDSVIESIVAGTQPLLTTDESLRAIRVVFAAYESAQAGKRILVDG